MEEGTIIHAGLAPSPWPPAHPIELLSRTSGDRSVRVSVDERGRFEVSVTGPGRVVRTRLSQCVELVGAAQILVIVQWSPDSLDIEINGRRLIEYLGSSTPRIALPNSGRAAVPTRRLIFPAIDSNRCSDRTERLFLDTVRDLDAKVLKRDAYEIVRAAALVRQLLLDGANSLVDRVNRTHHVPLTFTVVKSDPPPAGFRAHWAVIDPTDLAGVETIAVKRDTFLATQCLMLDGIPVSVKETISACANAKGGVHYGNPDGRAQEAVLTWDDAVRLVGVEPSNASMAGICTVLLHALEPLVEAIAARHAAT